jgi:hypothetical protein
MGLRCADPPRTLHFRLETASWATWRHGSALCRPSPHSPPLFGDGLVGHAAAWVCVVQTLPAFSTFVWRRPRGPRGGMGLRRADPPRILHPCLETALWATRRHGSALCRPSPHSPPLFGDGLVGHHLYHSERDGLCEPRVRNGRMLMRPPPTSLNLKVSRRRDQVGLWGSMDTLECVLPPLLLLGLIAILVTQVSSDARGRQWAGPPLPAFGVRRCFWDRILFTFVLYKIIYAWQSVDTMIIPPRMCTVNMN